MDKCIWSTPLVELNKSKCIEHCKTEKKWPDDDIHSAITTAYSYYMST